jgi:hypothetical protein
LTIEEFAEMVLAAQKQRLAEHFSQRQADAEIVEVKPGPKYTKVDFGTGSFRTGGGGMSGKFMVENATGVIYGIKGYGVVHKGRRYGTLQTTDEWDWSGYGPVRKEENA